jgi:hypothetical protein
MLRTYDTKKLKVSHASIKAKRDESTAKMDEACRSTVPSCHTSFKPRRALFLTAFGVDGTPSFFCLFRGAPFVVLIYR